MSKLLRRMATGVTQLLKDDRDYFTEGRGTNGHTHFREDIRAIVGGALAAMFVVAALANLTNVPELSGTIVTVAVAGIGGVAGHFVLA
jgi:hypothetical protein